ncbi:Two-component signal transduction histidine kinase [Altererythrobacter epoxidivorans]|uniref:histidine kinase n=1 Tax=Altererythrobacter epoxidivorans TaxID=361183 RepID=A0A0M5KYH9_9SPHN|nr:HAMP domain-containing sensor histidine kinase [Altererythrobacter epoxidivorans]ALE16531.1 Two-component signal transduction histidine kinase [Altererythrobacter epoxidivorans]
MAGSENLLAARGITDGEDRLLSADPPLAELQERCGGSIPGTLAIPELLDLVRQGRQMGLRLAREFSAFDGVDKVSGFVRINPLETDDGAVCELLVENWHRESRPVEDAREMAARQDAIDRASAEFTARLDASQRVLTIDTQGADLLQLAGAMRGEPGKCWHDYVHLEGIAHRQPLHWRLLDGSRCTVEGSERGWTARLMPIGGSTQEPHGFELLLIADHPLMDEADNDAGAEDNGDGSLIGEALAPALRQPVSRIIANAETIRARLAGPLRPEYSDYAADISAAGQHLAGLLDDLADLEVVEAPDFTAAKDRIDLADAARRAGGILGVRARDKDINLVLPQGSMDIEAIGEFRRILQILLNLVGNAINYSPAGSRVEVTVGQIGAQRVTISVSDEGPGISEEQRARVFEKFERLGRDGDGGSGLGLYISQRLANAMGGELQVESEEGAGATFTLFLPRA